jgi:hypothetical protein
MRKTGGTMRQPKLLLILVLLLLLGGMAAKAWLVPSPSVREASASGEFNAQRAKARLTEVLGDQEPHPADSAANDAVRERLIAQLAGMGLKPEVRDQFACNEQYKSPGVTCARVRNVVVSVGPAAGKRLLLAAHYDSTPVGPGAGDDGVGVATLLEVAYLLKDMPLARPVTFLFDEGEELGLIGARAFVEADPLHGSVDSLLNFEARGVRGPVNMFETSRPNAPALAAFGKAVQAPVANSLSTDVYRLLPNYTDVNTFDGRGWTTLNFAMIGHVTRYHSGGDTLAALDLGSLQHRGDQALRMAKELSAGVPQASGQRIFMDLLGAELIQMPQWLGLALLAALVIGLAWVAWKRRALGRGLGSVAVAFVLSAMIAWIGLAVVGAIRPGMFWRAEPIWTRLAVYASAILPALLAFSTIARPVDRERMRAAFWLFFVLVGAAIALVAPGGTIFFLFPPLLFFISTLARNGERWGALTAIVLLFLTWGAMLGLLEELLNQGPMWVFAPLGSLIILPVLIEAKPLMRDVSPRWVAGAGSMLAILGWCAASAAPAYSADRQQRFTIEYVRDADTGKASWSVLNDDAPLPRGFDRAGQWHRGAPSYSERKRWLADAPVLTGIGTPRVQVNGQAHEGDVRRVRLQIAANGAQSITLLSAKGADISSAGSGAFVRPIAKAGSGDRTMVRCFGRSCDGATIELTIRGDKPVAMTVLGWRRGLPPQARPLLAVRPKFARPQYVADGTTTVHRIKL